MPERPLLIDAHSHICFSAYRDDAPEVIARAEGERIWQVAVGSQIDTSRRAVEYAERYPHVWAAVGLHPSHLHPMEIDEQELGNGRERVRYTSRPELLNVAAYRALAEHPKTVAIGECGIDYSYAPSAEHFEVVARDQDAAFRAQITLAQSVVLPLIIHVRDGAANAHDATLAILAATHGAWRMAPPFGLIHCYTGTWSQAQQYLALGFNISFTGIITFAPTKKRLALAEELVKTIRGVPMDRFHVETDCPYLTPEPHRGERNEPRFVRHVAERIASVRGVMFDEVARASVVNTLALFPKINIG